MKKYMFLPMIALLLSACSNYPERADKEVLELVAEVCIEALTIELTY
jgi:uncharacterized protein YcfL